MLSQLSVKEMEAQARRWLAQDTGLESSELGFELRVWAPELMLLCSSTASVSVCSLSP